MTMHKKLMSHADARTIYETDCGGEFLPGLERAIMDGIADGVCLYCGTVHEETCEPDAIGNYCDECDEYNVVVSIVVLYGLM